MSETSIRELEWFDLETRLREIIYQQFEVFNKKTREDRENQSLLSTNVAGLEKRLSLVEGCIFGESSPHSALGDLYKKISDVEGSRKKDNVRIDQEFINCKENFKTTHFQISGINEYIKRLEGIQNEFSKDIKKVNEIADEHQVLILAEIETINKHFQELNASYLEKGLKLEEKMNATNIKLDDIGLGLSKYDRQFESIKKSLNEIFISLNILKTNKLEYETFETESLKTEARLTELYNESQAFRNGFIIRDSFMDKFIPLQTFNILSDALHNSLDSFARKRLAEYENTYLKKLHSSALDVNTILTREESIASILDNIKYVEQRKTEILIEKIRESPPVVRNENKSHTTKVIIEEKNYENYVTKGDITQKFDKYCEQQLEPLLNKYKIEIFEKIELIKKNISISENECMLYIQEVLREVEDFKVKEGKDINRLELSIQEIMEEEKIFQLNIKEILQVIGSTSQMIVCLVENAQIDLALSAQEEEIRQEAIENPVLKHRGQDRLSKKCMSFISGHSIMQLRQPQGKSSPLLYRSKKFTRGELVEMKGKMLKYCWESVSKNIPWKQDEFELIISEALKSLKLASSEESQIETPQPPKDMLPYVTSPSLRNKTPRSLKFKVGALL